MAGPLQIFTLGPLEIRVNDLPLTALNSRKAQALLVFLARTGKQHSRETLADLLAGEHSDARSSFRLVLFRLRQHLGPYLITTRRSVGLKPDAYWLDSTQFETYAASISSVRRQSSAFLPQQSQLEQSLALYKGEFLADFYVHDAEAFEKWMLSERAHLQHLVIDTLRHLSAGYLEAGNYQAAIAHTRHLLQLDPYVEDAHRQMMRMQFWTGQRNAALAQYEECGRTLIDDLGVEPEEETKVLYEKIRSGELPTHRATENAVAVPATHAYSAPIRSLPAPSTPFLGRSIELTKVASLLNEPDCRILTLVGPGGIGKTRLAIQAAEKQQSAFTHGVCFVPLAALNTPDLLVPAIAEALEFPFHTQDDPQTQLFNYLREKQLLLILDNFEHLEQGADLVTKLLEAAPALKILVTSRQKLNLHGEWLFDVQGMPYPLDGLSADVHALESYAAVQLFVQTAKRARIDFSLVDEWAAAVRICQMTEGLPLAIELAAALVRLLSCTQIAANLENRLDILTSTWRDIPERHRSVRAAFEQSWRLLTPEECAALRRLSVFRGGFTAGAAQDIGELRPSTLAILVDKSLIRYDAASHRYGIHELVRQYAADKLAESGEDEAVGTRHFDFFYSLTDDGERKMHSSDQLEWRDRFEADYDNLRVALEWSLAHENRLQAGLQMCGNLFWFWGFTNRVYEGCEWTNKLLAHPSAITVTANRAWALHGSAWLYNIVGDFDTAYDLLQESRRIALKLNHKLLLAQALYGLASVFREKRRYTDALQAVKESISLCQEVGNDFALGIAVDVHAMISYEIGDDLVAAASLEQALTVGRRLNDLWMIGMSLYSLSVLALRSEKPENAHHLVDEAINAFRTLGDRVSYHWVMRGLTKEYLKQGDNERAYRLLQEQLTISRDLGFYPFVADNLFDLGIIARRRHAEGEAKNYFEESLSIYRRLDNQAGVEMCLAALNPTPDENMEGNLS